MKIKITCALLMALLLNSVVGIAADNPVNADYVVAPDGSGDFTTLQAAIDAVPSNQTDRRTVIFIKNGLYNTEKLLIPSDKINISLIGESRDQTIISYHIYDCGSNGEKCPEEDAALWSGNTITTSATLTIRGDGFRAENLTIKNTAGPVGQALAITVQADKTVFVNCDILGYQDTIYLWTAGKRSYFENCLVVGRTDYIYGAGIAFFESCEIRSWGGGWITAPSTPKSQAYGYVFNQCDLTYALNSPRNGDDGALVRFGRPWHEYPKVAWLNCSMTDKIHPEGWGDTWRMDYASTSADLHLYEYNNSGPGADMSGRADWAGLKELTADEATNYTIAKVLNGSDGWAPYEEAPLVTIYTWDNGGTDSSWLNKNNWDPDSIPETAEVGMVEGNVTINADGGTFSADLYLQDGATLNLTSNSTVNYLVGNKSIINIDTDASLNGKLAVKDTVYIKTSEKATLNAALFGIHKIIKQSSGTVILTADNSNYSGTFIIKEGTLDASSVSSLGKANVEVKSEATLKVGNDNAFFPEAALTISSSSTILLDASITLSEFYIDGVLQDIGTYNETTHPGTITGSGSITVGRPQSFVFKGGPWDDVSGYTPTILPETGETVYCEGEMETASTANLANVIFVDGKGKLRLRGTHTSTGTLTFEGGSRILYATSGSGFSLEAPIVFNDDINFEMSSKNTSGSTMTLKGSISGSDIVFVKNTRTDVGSIGKVLLGGDNSNFSGTWDLSTVASHVDGYTAIEGASANAFGTGKIIATEGNQVILNHESCAGDTLRLEITSPCLIDLKKDILVEGFYLNGVKQDTGVYSLTTNPEIFSGDKELYVGVEKIEPEEPEEPTNSIKAKTHENIKIEDHIIKLNGNNPCIKIYNINGTLRETIKNKNLVSLKYLPKGIYILKYSTKNNYGTLKFTR